MPKWQTQGGRPQKIVTANCDSNMSNTLVTQAYGTSGNKYNLKPGCDESLSKIHSIIVGMKRLGTFMKFYGNFQNEHGCKKVQTLDFSVQTHCNCAHSETMCGTSNQYVLNVYIHKIACEGGIDKDLFDSHYENTYKILPTSDEWVLWA